MRWLTCNRGTHWGPFGAAGLLLAHERRYVVLERRAGWVDDGGTYGIPGGALLRDEPPIDGAVREAREELFGLDRPLGRVLGLYANGCDCGWAYTTVVVDAPALAVAARSRETDAVGWFAVEDIATLPLHPGFAVAWPSLRQLMKEAP